MSTNPRYSQYGGASSPSRGTGVYTGKITLIYDDGRVRVFINTFGRNIGPCRIINKSAGDAISLNDEVLCTYANDTSDELIVVGRLTERVDPVSESTSGLIVEASTTSELVRITQKGTGAALLVEDSTNPDSTPFIIDASGNVGIGTASPTETLDVRGNIYTTGSVIFEGTDNLHETTLAVTDPTADRTITLPNNTGTVALLGDTTYVGTTAITLNRSSANLGLTGITSVAMPGSTSGTLTIQPTAITGTATITFPANTGTVITTGNLSSITSTGTLTDLTVTNAINGTLTKTVTGTNTADLIYGNMADNDQFRIRIGGTATNAGYVEIATADDGTEPIYVRQYSGVFTTLTRTATLLDGSGNTSFPGTVTATTFSGNASTATNLSTDRNNWSTNGTISAAVGQLAWKNYGNNHTIFDASQSTSPQGGAVNNTNATIPWSSTYPTLMGWNGASTYGVRVDSARISDNTTGNAATATSATSATSATTATNQSGGTVSATYLTVTGGQWLRTTDGGGWYNDTHGLGLNAFSDGYIKTYPGNGVSTSFSANFVYVNGRLLGPGANSHPFIQMRESNAASWSWTGTYTMYVDITPVKTFVIDHPMKQDNYLVHACAEGPTSDVFYRGTGQLQNGVTVIELPDYFESLTEEEGRTVMITPIADEMGNAANLAAHEIYEGKFIVELAAGYIIKNQRFWWRVDAVRKNTFFAVEPEKSSVTVSGDGPYTYIQRT